MVEIRNRGVLLDKLMELESCEYLSELKDPRMRPAILRTLVRFSTSGYTMEQWNYALSYITEETLEFRDAEELTAYLHRMDGREK